MRELLVEDDAQIAASIKMLLINENFICDTTDLGEDGLEVGKLYDYDIILLDLMLPDIDGYEVLRRLRAARVRTPILILSGLAAHAAIGGLMEPFEEVLDLGVPHGLGRLIDAPHRGRWK
jgi:DNA-binding response OmpR family regulator